MQLVEGRTSFTGKAMAAFVPWIAEQYKYSVGQINLGNNSNSNLEVVSSLNCLNIAVDQYYYRYINCTEKSNPKVYIGTIHTVSNRWNSDVQDPEKVDPKWVTANDQKSGSWPL